MANQHELVGIPARLLLGSIPTPVHPSGLARVGIAVTWGAGLAALLAAALGLRSAVAYADRRARFASTVTHELRTPLTTFRLYSDMLARGMVPEDRRPEYYATLEHEAARLSGLVENVLAYARLEEGRAGLRRDATDVDALCAAVMPDLEARVAAAGSQLEAAVDADPETPLATDTEAVGQVLFILVDNACKYGITSGPPTVTLHVARTGDRLELAVRDSGPRVPAEVEEAIFEAFDRGGRDESDPSPGVGLGLALARGLAEDLGGGLSLEPSAAGATFVLHLPVQGGARDAD